MRYFSDSFIHSRQIDPCNTNNIVSDDMTYNEKLLIKEKASQAIFAKTWSDVVW